eukprot:14673960-Heterocapsa_arctica.AAC.1
MVTELRDATHKDTKSQSGFYDWPQRRCFLPAITTDKPKEPYNCSAQVLKALEPDPTGEMKSQLVLQ